MKIAPQSEIEAEIESRSESKVESKIGSEVVVLILAGGRGERFWPRSTKQKPKQLQEIYSQKTLLAETLERARLLTTEGNIFIGCSAHFREAILRRHPEFSTEFSLGSIEEFSEKGFIIEPEGRNTAPMIALAALELERRFPGAIHVVMPADHYITPPEDFVKTLKKAIQSARNNFLVTLGIPPRSPDSQYGYIQAAEAEETEKNSKSRKDRGTAARKILSFTEKPDRETAKKYLAQGNYFWNSGIFIWPGRLILSEFEEHAPHILNPLKDAQDKPQKLSLNFKQIPKLPIDIAIMEKSSKAAMITAKFQWDDLGSWTSLERVLKKDSKGNILFTRQDKGMRFASLESSNNIIAVDEGLAAFLGVQDIILVQEGKVIFLAQRKSLDKMKEFLEQMRKNPALQEYID